MSKRSNIIQMIVFLGFIALFAVLFLVVPDREFSEQENRYLDSAPKFSFEALFEGKFTKKFEDYLTDQFVGRDEWISMKAASELALGKQANNGVYLCDEDTLIQRFEQPDPQRFEANTAAIEKLCNNVDVPVYLALIPGAADIWRDKLPKKAPNADQSALIGQVYSGTTAAPVDIRSALEAHKDEYIYYRTDHHWTSLGAYYGYQALMESMELTPLPMDAFEQKTVSDAFFGTTYSKCGMHWVAPDSMEIFESDIPVTITNYSDGTPAEGSLYVMSFLEQKDKYSMFMGGNTPLVTIETQNADAPSLLIIRDSYTDSMVQFLIHHFSEIHIMDLRYNKNSVQNYVAENGIDQVLVMYSVSNFSTDVNVTQLGS